jgi:hypothetical protein
MRHNMPSLGLPSLKRIERQIMMSPRDCSTVTCWRTLASESPVAVAISESSCSPVFFR